MTAYRITAANGSVIDVTFETAAPAPLTLIEREDMTDNYYVKDANGELAVYAGAGHVIDITIMTPGPFTVEAV
jgi:hypothetical protein